MCGFFCFSDGSISTRVDMLASQAEVTRPLWQREETVESQLMTTSQSSDRELSEPITKPYWTESTSPSEYVSPPSSPVRELRVL
jgi:hypothetical protein